MRVLLVGGLNTIHTVRWANGLHRAGLDVHVASALPSEHELDMGVTVHDLYWPPPQGYLLNIPQLKRIVRRLRPDVINAHYASGYGTLVNLSGVRPVLLSVWGSDVYDVPLRSALYRRLIIMNLSSATAVGSTSHAMARVVQKLHPHENVFVTPFGVDTQKFSPLSDDRRQKSGVVIGTVKTLAPKYGVDLLVQAFAAVRERLIVEHPPIGRALRLAITGKGKQERELRELSLRLGIEDCVTFYGAVDHAEVPAKLHELDIFVALSRRDSESFGVAVVEASACGLPVVVSDADGLAEVTVDGVTGLIVPKGDINLAAEALVRLVLDKALRQKLGRAGRAHVIENYTWSRSVTAMVGALEATAETPAPDR